MSESNFHIEALEWASQESNKLEISFRVHNIGGQKDTQNVKFLLGDSIIKKKEMTLDVNETQSVELYIDQNKYDPGWYPVLAYSEDDGYPRGLVMRDADGNFVPNIPEINYDKTNSPPEESPKYARREHRMVDSTTIYIIITIILDRLKSLRNVPKSLHDYVSTYDKPQLLSVTNIVITGVAIVITAISLVENEFLPIAIVLLPVAVLIMLVNLWALGRAS